MTQDQALRNGIAQRADTDLQSAAIRHQARRMKTGGVVGECYRFTRWCEQREIRTRSVEQKIELSAADCGLTWHKRQFRVDLTGKHKVRTALAAERQEVEREIGIAA